MTALHNMLKKERRALNQDDPQGAREDLDKAEREIHEKGLIGVLRELHDELDAAPAEPLDWPSDLKPRAQAVRAVMTHADAPLTVEQVAQHFHRARRSDVRELLETLAALWHMEATDGGVRDVSRLPTDSKTSTAPVAPSLTWSPCYRKERPPLSVGWVPNQVWDDKRVGLFYQRLSQSTVCLPRSARLTLCSPEPTCLQDPRS
jgi:hypothetical protein